MDEVVLIDTSAWVDFFRAPESPMARMVDHLLAEQLAATTGVVQAELLQGTRSKRQFRTLEQRLVALEQFDEPPDAWDRVARLGYRLHRGGHSGVGIPDLLSAVTAEFHGIQVLTRDHHFDAIASVSSVRLFP